MSQSSETLPGPEAGPDKPGDLGYRSWWRAARRAGVGVVRKQLTDRAAALTYYGVLSLFPALLVLVSTLGLVSPSAADTIIQEAVAIAPAQAQELVLSALENLRQSQGAGIAAVVGVITALWAASGYIGAFIRAANHIYEVPEGRPVWKTIPLQVGVTIVTGGMLVLALGIILVTGPVARWAGDRVGLGENAVTVWDIAKWPVLALLVAMVVATLYRVSPNARQGGFRWVSPGGVLAVVLWAIASAGFTLYVTTLGNYNKTYGAVAGVIIFLVWMWLSNLALLTGAAFDAELERTRVAAAGYAPTGQPYLAMRDDRAVPEPVGFDDADVAAAGGRAADWSRGRDAGARDTEAAGTAAAAARARTEVAGAGARTRAEAAEGPDRPGDAEVAAGPPGGGAARADAAGPRARTAARGRAARDVAADLAPHDTRRARDH
ncbi:MAG TPA: YihY/virulence factor BrkB family protein [Pilimelia sp.]|nr:YihY/virulence factor BrkB family protein [Pilimelia sp.]